MSKTPRRDEQATKNFLASGGHEFNGQDLSPFTPQRMAVAAEMGMKWPYVTEDDQITLTFEIEVPGDPKKRGKARKPSRQPIEIVHYRQSYKDSVIALWLCSQVESRVDRAERKPKEAMDAAYSWSKTINLLQGTPLAGSALVLWLQICAQVVESRSEPVSQKKGGGPPEDEDTGEL